MTDLELAKQIAAKIQEEGGCAFFVGGFVRDSLMHHKCKDIDIEVHGITPDTLKKILSEYGELRTIGSNFGVYNLAHHEIDFAMPRMEKLTGRGHKDFEIFVDPFLGTRKAAMRRDFTINALMQNVLTGEIVDEFGGVQDLKDGIIRHVTDEAFAEDPLRVLRAAQFAARFEFDIDEKTMELMREMDLSALPKERIFTEMEKALLKAEKPSIFFEILQEVEQLDTWFPEMKSLIGCEQDISFHPEGDVWNHTMAVIDEAAQIRPECKNPLGFMLSAICHDFGKTTTSEWVDGHIHSYGHELAGVPLTESFLERLCNNKELIRYTTNMVNLHMRPNLLAAQHSKMKACNRMFDQAVCPEDLLLLAKADCFGSMHSGRYDRTEAFLRQALNVYYDVMSRPYVTGADLVKEGVKPGPMMGEALKQAHKLRLGGMDKYQALRQTLGYLKELEKQQNPES